MDLFKCGLSLSRSLLGSKLLRVWLWAAALTVAVASAQADVTVGDPAKPELLVQQLKEAYKANARNITIRPGTYNIPSKGGPSSAIHLKDWKDVVINASGVTLNYLEDDYRYTLLRLESCTNVTFQGATLTLHQPSTFQGKVTKITYASPGMKVEWVPDLGYPSPAGISKLSTFVVDAGTRLLKPLVRDLYHAPVRQLPSGSFETTISGTVPLTVGDWLVCQGGAPTKVALAWCRNCTISNVTMTRNGYACVQEDGGGGNRYIGCVWTTGPAPTGGTETPLASGSHDGFHSIGASPGPEIRDCVFEGVILDDCIAIRGTNWQVRDHAGGTISVHRDSKNVFTAGSPVRVAGKDYFQESKVVSTEAKGDLIILTLDPALPVPTGETKISNPDKCGKGYKIINNKIGFTRSRGCMLRGDNGLIRNNVIVECGGPSIQLGPDGGEAGHCRNVTIENNFIRGRAINANSPGIYIQGMGAMGNRNFIIRRNTMVSNFKVNLYVDYLDGLIFEENSVTGSTPLDPAVAPLKAVAQMRNSKNLNFIKNTVQNPASYETPSSLVIKENVTGVIGNDATNLKPVSSPLLNGGYKIATRQSGNDQVLCAAGVVAGAGLTQGRYLGRADQQWIVSAVDDNVYRLTNRKSGLVAGVTNASPANGSQVQLEDSTGAVGQLWTMTPTQEGYVTLQAVQNGMGMEVGGSGEGSKVRLGAVGSEWLFQAP